MSSLRIASRRLTMMSAVAAAGLVAGLVALPAASASASSAESGKASIANSLLSYNGMQYGEYRVNFEVKGDSIEYRAVADTLKYLVGSTWRNNSSPARLTYELKLIRGDKENPEHVTMESHEVFTQTTTAPEVTGSFPISEPGNHRIQLWIRADGMHWPGKYSDAIGTDVIFFGDIKPA